MMSPSSRQQQQQQQLLSNAADIQHEIDKSQLIEPYHGTQSTTDNSRDSLIEEFSSQENTQANNTNRLLLSQENSLFVNFVTPPDDPKDTEGSNQQKQPEQLNENEQMQGNSLENQENLSLNKTIPENNQNECAPGPSHAVSKVTNHEQNACVVRSNSHQEVIYRNPFNISSLFTYLYYVEIDEICSNVIRITDKNPELKIDLHLRFQCNAQNRIVISGEDSKQIMNLNEKQWQTVCRILKRIRKFESKIQQSVAFAGDSILHRTLYYLFKSNQTFSNLHVEYGDQDFDSVRVVMKPYVCGKADLTSCLDDYVLSNMEKYAAMQKEQENHSK